MSKLAAIQALAAKVAETGQNFNETVKGGAGAKLLPEGYAMGRVIEYVELGEQPQEYNGKAKAPKAEARLGIALWGADIQNEDGTPYIVRPYPFTLDQNEKAGAIKIFKALNWKGDKGHFAQCLGEGYLFKIIHVDDKKNAGKKKSRLDLASTLPPIDPVSKMPYPIPAVSEDDLLLFSFDYPTMEAWAELFIEGTWDDGKSKNREQEAILGAKNFAGSAVEAMLAANGGVPVAPAAPVTPAMPGGAGEQANPTGNAPNAGAAQTPDSVSQSQVAASSATSVQTTSSPSDTQPAFPSFPGIK